MAKIPEGSNLILNPASAGAGFKIKNVFCLPGVPLILQSMLPNIKNSYQRFSIYDKNIYLDTVEAK